MKIELSTEEAWAVVDFLRWGEKRYLEIAKARPAIEQVAFRRFGQLLLQAAEKIEDVL